MRPVARDVRGAGDSESRTVQPVSTIHGDTAMVPGAAAGDAPPCPPNRARRNADALRVRVRAGVPAALRQRPGIVHRLQLDTAA